MSETPKNSGWGGARPGAGGPKGKRKPIGPRPGTVPKRGVTLTLPVELLERLDKLAADTGRSRNAVLVSLLDTAMAQAEP